MGIESPVVHCKKPVRPPPAARGELEKAVPYALLYRVARRECMALDASVLARAESKSVHETIASVNQAARTCKVLCYQGGISRLQTLDGGHPKNPIDFSFCGVRTHTTKHRYLSLRCGASNVTSNTINILL